MKPIIPLLTMVLGLAACQGTDPVDLASLPPQERDAVTALAWLHDADASRDARQAIQRGDKRLYALATRNPSLPGVPAAATSKVKAVCGIRYLDGSTDMVFGDTHLKLLQEAQAYAAEYNKLMLDACLQQNP